MHRRKKRLAFLGFVVAHALGAYSSLQAIMESRTPQGATAWAVALNTFPYVAVPAYWVFGHSELDDQQLQGAARYTAVEIREEVLAGLRHQGLSAEIGGLNTQLIGRLSELPVTTGNEVELLIDGEATFASMFAAIEAAQAYVLVEFYILRDDELGRRFQQLLLRKAAAGVQVFLLYDQFGSHGLSDSYLRELQQGGVAAFAFNPAFEDLKEMRLNFRNHRKLVVVDGRIGFVGSSNVGDEYVGGAGELGFLRDTNVRVEGPAVTGIQAVFANDWYWVTEEVLEGLHWKPTAAPEGTLTAACLPSGPTDEFERGAMYFLHLLNRAETRVWIATPYFVPDQQMVTALQLAALRGVDVRILLPEQTDSQLVRLSSYSYLPELEAAGIQLFRYQPGFLHQKVLLVDDRLATVGSANFDNRSFRLNFELTLLVDDLQFAEQVEAMLLGDMNDSVPASAEDLTGRSYLFRIAVQVARLLAPIQ